MNSKIFLAALIIPMLTVSSFAFLELPKAHADSAHPLEDVLGFAWAGDTIGFIFMNCTSQTNFDNNGDIENDNDNQSGFNFKSLIKKAYADTGGVCNHNNYGVNVDLTTLYLNGYAWSPNIGWVQFGGLSGFPTNGIGTTQDNARFVYQINDGRMFGGNYKLTGWAKALAGDQQNDGWDGWISFDGGIDSGNANGGNFNQVNVGDGSIIQNQGSGSVLNKVNFNFGATKAYASPVIVQNQAATTYQIIVTPDGQFVGNNRYAWAGGQSGPVMGWIDFLPAQFPRLPDLTGPIITLYADPASVPTNNPITTMHWNGQDGNFTTCKPSEGTNLIDGSLSNWATLTLPNFDNVNQENNLIGGVTVPGSEGTSVEYDIECFDTITSTWIPAAQTALITIVPPPGPHDSFTVSKPCITEDDVAAGNNTITLNWSSTLTSSCSISNYGSVSAPGSGSSSVSVTQPSTTFTLTCTGTDGSSLPPISHVVSIAPICSSTGTPVIPKVKER